MSDNHQNPVIVWFRQDLRLEDNPALNHALSLGVPVIPVYIWSPEEEGQWMLGRASKWWLHYSLKSLDQSLQKKGSRLIIQKGPAKKSLEKIINETGAKSLLWNRRYEPQVIQQDTTLKVYFEGLGVEANNFNSSLLFEPWTIKTKQGTPYKVFTPFWRECQKRGGPPVPQKLIGGFPKLSKWPKTLHVDDLKLLPKFNWDDGIRATWTPGEKAALKALDHFVDDAVNQYQTGRNHPGTLGTSRLSPHLHFGEISPRMIWHRLEGLSIRTTKGTSLKDIECFLTEIGWREFAYHLLFHFPHTVEKPLQEKFIGFPWRKNKQHLSVWQHGGTGYPIVDAGMRELWHTGWMHNRVRMIVASFLVKDLLIHWNEGAKWFWDTLVDADLASNTLGWQWTAGCGADAAPFFRIFNPTLQGERFDPEGTYIKQWIPELKSLPKKWIHKPHLAKKEILEKSGVILGENYPFPIIEHNIARDRALAIFKKLKIKGAA